MAYEPPVNFDSVEVALEFIKTELQSKIEANNLRLLEIEKVTASSDLLKAQYEALHTRAEELNTDVANLEAKRETIKQEVREHTKKTTERLEKERSDFEAVRIKRRNELITIENDLNTRSQTLDQLQASLTAQESDLKNREASLNEALSALADSNRQVMNTQVRLDKENSELMTEKHRLEALDTTLSQRESTIADSNAQSEKRQKQVEDLVILSEERMSKIETIAKNQDIREVTLNNREASLKELDKLLTAKKIQLDDRQATEATH